MGKNKIQISISRLFPTWDDRLSASTNENEARSGYALCVARIDRTFDEHEARKPDALHAARLKPLSNDRETRERHILKKLL